ncbi:NO-inducible flavohemoprotein [Halobacillus sp. Marseille-Q1614]|uniref:NO-inducible flavohemoprotein n=1 Tax=Halobacillus sp. Marseille-Q1614 TaxID=2709134 RepID=UPI00156F2944|nr:NO-inducible flavohemoprotein [Halobacillus sp. Marseille-Q1614]
MRTESPYTLDQKTIETVKATVPVLAEHGEAITKHFYQRLFEAHPELKNIFNMTNQRAGRQSKALAGAVYAAAAHIDNLSEIFPAVNQIAEKHRSLNVRPEHYPIVGKYLLIAIKEVLQDAATPDIMEAWEEAYGVIAQAFIDVEAAKYKDAEGQTGGWSGFRNFTIDKKVQESNVITSFYLKAEDGKPIASFRPGQYITVKIDIPGEKFTHLRQYSLSDAPDKGYYRISVKREDGLEDNPDGVVSNYLHQELKEGDILPITAPAGDFFLEEDSDAPLVLISGGVGLTPMMSMLQRMKDVETDRDVYFIHAAQNEDVHAFKEDVRQAAERMKSCQSKVIYSEPLENGTADKEGVIELEWLRSIAPGSADFYFCGPTGFMKAVNHMLKEWGIPEERINFEFFGPKQEI